MAFIRVKNLIFDYFRRDDSGTVQEVIEALSDINMNIRAGSYISIVGGNGSGKSTLAKNLNALLTPTEGTVLIDGISTDEEEKRIAIRKQAGMVFQNPDNQLVASVVEEDVAFGPENLGIESEEIVKRVNEVLDIVGLSDCKKHLVSNLSGGQKQKVAIAGTLAMSPKCMILDEATAMLPPQDRTKILDLTHELNQKYNMTIIHITHHMEEIIQSDYVYAMAEGKILFEGKPEILFSKPDIVAACNLTLPLHAQLKQYFPVSVVSSEVVMNDDTLAQAIAKKVVTPRSLTFHETKNEIDFANSLILDHVSYQYANNRQNAISDVSVAVQKGECLGIVGSAGAGKSTLLQIMNGLLKPTSGTVYYESKDVHDEDYNLTDLRQRVGLVFQYPEYQLFGETVFQDVVYGPYQQDIKKVEAEKRAFQAIKDMHLDESIYDLSPFTLSGGVKRKVAIAGVLAMQPDFLILDEPTVGLDPKSRSEILEYITALREKRNIGIVVVSHSMEDIAEYTDRVLVMHEGRLLLDATTREFFMNEAILAEAGLALPDTMQMAKALRKQGLRLQPDIMKKRELLYALGIEI